MKKKNFLFPRFQSNISLANLFIAEKVFYVFRVKLVSNRRRPLRIAEETRANEPITVSIANTLI